jgi:hypothetical protein
LCAQPCEQGVDIHFFFRLAEVREQLAFQTEKAKNLSDRLIQEQDQNNILERKNGQLQEQMRTVRPKKAKLIYCVPWTNKLVFV